MRIHDEVLGGYQPGQKIVPERKLALLLDTSQSRIHRAIELLSRQGLVQTRRGDGTYVVDPANRVLAEDASLTPPQMQHHFRKVSKLPLQIRIPIGENLREQSMWQRAIAAYQRENPSIEVEIDFSTDGSRSANCDVTVVSAHHLHEHQGDFSVLNQSSLEQNGFRAAELLPHATTPCCYEGELLGMPVLRTTSILMANRRILDRFGIDPACFTKPVDLFRIGAEIETGSGGRIRGCNYYGLHWHLTLAGLQIGSGPGGAVSQPQKLARFLEDHRPFMREHHFKQTHLGQKLFLLGEFALRTDYSYLLPAAQLHDDLELIVLPRNPGGWAVEGMCVACMPRDCPGREEAYALLAFLASGTAQQQLVADDPHWLSVHPAVLEAQKTSAPFPAGAVQHDLDQRSFSVFRDRRSFQSIGPHLEAESEEYFLGRQDLETTLANMKKGDT